MKSKINILLISLCLLLYGYSSISQSLDTLVRPKLIVGIVIDQMRHDYIYRYWDKYGDGGFKRLVNQGFSCENTQYNYVPTNTAPGHSAIYTGTTPAFHGIIGNEWFQRYSRKAMYCVEDPTVKAVGGVEAAGKMSPVNLLATTITDELRLFTYDRAKVVGLSLKDRGSIIPAGHHPTGAYWFDPNTLNFMTSTFYMSKLPGWVADFNNKKWCEALLKRGWTTLRPLNEYTESLSDENDYEGRLAGDKRATFPREFDASKPNSSQILSTPLGNSLITEMALAALKGESLGLDKITDFLAISYSSPDYAGHLFGLQSVEVEDLYLRLDLELSRLLDSLDQVVGPNQYLLFLSADHAVAQVPQLLKDQHYPGDYFKGSKMLDSLKGYLDDAFGPYIIDGFSNNQIYLNEDRIKNKKLDRPAVVLGIKNFVKSFDGVIDAFERNEVPFLSPVNPTYGMILLGYYPPRSGDIMIITQPGWFESSFTTGTTHGSPYKYDTHVPLLWYGYHIQPGKSYKQYAPIDIAPTLSQILNIPLPSASIGQVITELFHQ
ncbi:MAG: alkaline phosphatase family protein [Saprospiraceae bacterium]|jgi:predicted AlkP superfamily pyrophosphatase or phosphodiesterase|nr:alkaline phosphatase family protein [Saprospiraceae bacterium]MBK7436345.1 alkaline phosphatase family protein [Saprospiraceae bacterium]MBK8514473.1 alkaline phosphatase family protein [Saprospiraceae bacterium]MBK9679981.1 alkaline phosphatase family protein [Saprospiraceae bacterium]MBK9929117.1 alkaline phosphatase family protein [Saprospiraceae bacterium]